MYGVGWGGEGRLSREKERDALGEIHLECRMTR